MTIGDGIRRNIAYVEPAERALLRDALIELNRRTFPGARDDPVPGGVTWWFKQDEIHQATHVHHGPEFLTWHREIVNNLESMLRQVNPQLSLHYWDWTQDPRGIPGANLGKGMTGTLNLFTADFMGYGGPTSKEIGEPWLSARYYIPGATPHRDVSRNPADPPRIVRRSIVGAPLTIDVDNDVVMAPNFTAMRFLLEQSHDMMHGFVNMGGLHISFRDPFVFLLHSNVDRLLARWQTDPAHPERLDPATVYAPESDDPGLNGNIEPWSTGRSVDQFGDEHVTRPWAAPENQGVPHTYKDPNIVKPPLYDTNFDFIATLLVA
ncbi:tyrosinase family protein [Mesorhizobium sp. M0012]|uniref:tyrosinase family protein n=1 Tax=Mesorhizobium sp. M0012 TaxID=2956840 RepID=UPI00333AC590